MSGITWPKPFFLSMIGLDSDHTPNQPRIERLAEAAVASKTGGARAVFSEAAVDGKGGVTSLKIDYWRMRPNGEQATQTLIEMEFDSHQKTVEPRSVWVMGRKVYDAEDDAGNDDGTGRNVNRVIGAVQTIHRDLRRGQLPEVALIFKNNYISQSVGEALPIVGSSPSGGEDFDIHEQPADKFAPLLVPPRVAGPLLGVGVNTLDPHNIFERDRLTTANDKRNGKIFSAAASIRQHNRIGVDARVAIEPLEKGDDQAAMGGLTVQGRFLEQDGKARLKRLSFLGIDSKRADLTTRMRVIGVLNRMMHDTRRRDYPVSMDHIIDFDLRSLVDNTAPPPLLAKGGRMTMTSKGGNTFKEIFDGYGTTIGGNCKLITHEGLDANGQRDAVMVAHDLGAFMPTNGEANRMGLPDLTEEFRRGLKHLFVTHRHWDHKGALGPYVAKGYMRDVTVYATPKVIRAILEDLRSTPGIHEDQYPAFYPLSGRGWVHIEKDGIRRMTVGYDTNATPHSTGCTPMGYIGRYGDKVTGVYMNPGDARFEPGMRGEDWFRNFVDLAITEDTALKQALKGRRPTLLDIDVTGIMKKGMAPNDALIEANTCDVLSCFPGKGIVASMISTNDNRLRIFLRLANKLNRDVVMVGANLEHTATTMNVLGVDDEADAELRKIQRYMDDHFAHSRKAELEQLRKLRDEAVNRSEQNVLAREVQLKERVLEEFGNLRTIQLSSKRYATRQEREQALGEEFGQPICLGSMWVSRTSGVARQIFNGPASRRMALITGTQGNIVEIDAQLMRWSEGRALFDALPGLRKTALPLVPHENVVLNSQSAIPGNESPQTKMRERMVTRGTGFIQPDGDGFDLHRIDDTSLARLKKKLERRGTAMTPQEDGSIAVQDMPLHNSGHGAEGNVELAQQTIAPDYCAPQHTSNPQAVDRHNEVADRNKIRHAGRVFFDGEIVDIAMNNCAENARIHCIGREPSSLIDIRINRKTRQYHSGHMEGVRRIAADGEGGLREDGLLASVGPKGSYAQNFASLDADKSRKAYTRRKVERKAAAPINRTLPVLERLHRGPVRPGAHLRKPLRSQTFRRNVS